MIVQHYLQLLKYHLRWVIWGVLLTAGITAAGSTVLLKFSPDYTAAASVAMLPTEAEYAYGRDTGSGPHETARGLTATYIEYLKSRPVIEATFEKIAGRGGLGKPVPPPSGLKSAVRASISFVRRMYRTVDSGSFVKSTPREAQIRRLMGAIGLHKVADSYILRVEVTLEDPRAAAAVANALAEAYVEHVSAQLETSTAEVAEFLAEQIAMREVALEQLIEREEELERELGVPSVQEERQSLMRSRETERRNLVNARIELGAAQAELQTLARENLVQSGRSLTELNEVRSLAQVRVDTAQRSIQLRQRTINDLTASLDVLSEKQEEPLADMQRRRVAMEQGLTELNNRMLTTNLATSAALTQVRVIDPAVPPVYPSSPHVINNTIVAVIVSLLGVFLAVVGVDALSGTVKTTTDLTRIAGSRCVGSLSRRHLVWANEFEPHEARRRLSQVGALLERRLVILGAFDAPRILLTGFAPAAQLEHVTTTLELALAVEDRKLTRRAQAGGPVSVRQGQLAVTTGGAAEDEPFRVVNLGPVRAELSLAHAARRSPSMICLIPSGQVADGLVQDLLQKALADGVHGMAFVLLEP